MEISIVKYFNPGVDSTEFQIILISGRFAAGVAVSSHAVSLVLPTVNLDLAFSSLSGLYLTVMCQYVMSLRLLGEICDLGIKKHSVTPNNVAYALCQAHVSLEE